MTKWEFLKNNYIDKGIKIIPILENKKIPAINKWNEYCSSDYMQVLCWYENNHNINYGIPCLENDLFVIDLDVHDENKNGIENFKKLIVDIMEEPIDIYECTLTQSTPSKGLHLIFKSDEELNNVKGIANAFKDYQGIDLRNRNYILCEPSEINGVPYKFLNKKEPQSMPFKLKQFILDNVDKIVSDKKEPYKKPTSVEVGDRDNQLFSYINNVYFKTSLDYEEVLVLAKYFNENTLEEPFSDKTVEYKVRKVFEKDRDLYIHIKIHDE